MTFGFGREPEKWMQEKRTECEKGDVRKRGVSDLCFLVPIMGWGRSRTAKGPQKPARRETYSQR